jgi:hypothetical protein
VSAIALVVPAARPWRRFADAVRKTGLGIAEGFAAARRYERLAVLSDGELARRGLRREDVGWFALYGEPRPR